MRSRRTVAGVVENEAATDDPLRAAVEFVVRALAGAVSAEEVNGRRGRPGAGRRPSVNAGRPAAGGRCRAAMMDRCERFVASGPLRIWTERAGGPARPGVLMVMGPAAQGISCPDALVERLVERGAQVIRFDHRDTGRSSVVDFEAHPYEIRDMAARLNTVGQ